MMLSNLKRLYIKLVWVLLRTWRAIRLLPVRIQRLAAHFVNGLSSIFSKKSSQVRHWWQDLALLLLDLLAFPELGETLMDFAKWQTRPLSPLEKKLAVSVFGNAIWLDQVRVDESARIGCKTHNIAYVSYFVVNSWGKMHPRILIHELVHVWQFQKLGGSYIANALRAQASPAGYNYGGVEELVSVRVKGGGLEVFNLEQQADIVSDYYAVREGLLPAWGKATKSDLPAYEYFIAQIRNGS